MWLALTLFSFVGLLASLFALARLGFDATGKPRRVALPLVVGAILCCVTWAWSLSRVPPPYPIENTRRFEAPH